MVATPRRDGRQGVARGATRALVPALCVAIAAGGSVAPDTRDRHACHDRHRAAG
jgi:hypothetical protein